MKAVSEMNMEAFFDPLQPRRNKANRANLNNVQLSKRSSWMADLDFAGDVCLAI